LEPGEAEIRVVFFPQRSGWAEKIKFGFLACPPPPLPLREVSAAGNNFIHKFRLQQDRLNALIVSLLSAFVKLLWINNGKCG